MPDTIKIPNSRIVFDMTEKRVYREWIPIDGRLYWKPPNAQYRYSVVERSGTPKPKSKLKAGGFVFSPAEAESLLLEDFVYLAHENAYLHIPSRARLTARQISRIFPLPLTIHFADGKRKDKNLRANYFIKRHSRLNFILELP